MADGNEDWIYNLLLHEIGHALLIDHSDVPGTVMLPDGFGPGRPVLMPDDIAAVQAVWGSPAGVPPDLAEAGRLFAPAHAVAWRGTAGDDTFSPVVYGALDDLFAGGFGADHIEGGNGNDTLMGNGLYWTNWDNPAHTTSRGATTGWMTATPSSVTAASSTSCSRTPSGSPFPPTTSSTAMLASITSTADPATTPSTVARTPAPGPRARPGPAPSTCATATTR